MKPEERLFDLIGNLPDDLSCQTDAPKKIRRKVTPKTRNRWIGLGVAACLMIAVGAWSMTYTPPYLQEDFPKNSPLPVIPDRPADTAQTNAPAQTGQIKLNWPKVTGAMENDLRFTMLPVGDRVAEYHQVNNPAAIPKDDRPQYLGQLYNDLEGWYLPEDFHGLRYLIHREEDGSYTLWEFSSFEVLDEQTKLEMAENLENSIWATVEWFHLDLNFDPYPYSEVLETVYGVTSAEDLRSVTVNPATMDNTDEGKKLQKQIGTRTVSNRDDLTALYEAIADMTCYGTDNWELIHLGATDPDGGLSNQVRLCRYLTIETAHGTISNLKYSAAGGQFYEYSGIAYDPLDTDTAAKMNEIFHIEP